MSESGVINCYCKVFSCSGNLRADFTSKSLLWVPDCIASHQRPTYITRSHWHREENVPILLAPDGQLRTDFFFDQPFVVHRQQLGDTQDFADWLTNDMLFIPQTSSTKPDWNVFSDETSLTRRRIFDKVFRQFDQSSTKPTTHCFVVHEIRLTWCLVDLETSINDFVISCMHFNGCRGRGVGTLGALILYFSHRVRICR